MTELEKLEADSKLLYPLKYYKEELKEKFDTEIKNLFEELHKKSKVDENQNKKLVEDYNKAVEEEKKQEKKLKFLKILNTICLIILGLSLIYGVFILWQGREYEKINAFKSFGISIISGGLSFFYLKKKIGNFEEIVKALQEKVEEKYKICFEQLWPLLSLFESNISAKIISKLLPSLKVDENFKIERYAHLVERFGFRKKNNQSFSTNQLLSGEMLGNPFVILKNKINKVVQHTYHGSITISWTEYRINAEGKRESVHRTQTLTASVTKPKQIFYNKVKLLYANDAAENLIFNREPNNTHKKGAVSSTISNFLTKRKINKQNEKSETFTKMSNEEFDILFKALDRNNEVEFRVLFTPIAQKNMIDLMKDKEFGDDFYFNKLNKINSINNDNNWDISIDRECYYTHSFEELKKSFINMNNKYFYNFYKIFLPIFSIPIYQQHKSLDYIYGDDYYYNYNPYLSEYFANRLGEEKFLHPESNTEGILKTKTKSTNGASDLVEVEAHSYKVVQRVEYIPRYGGDGRWHQVPVYWDEYIPLDSTSTFEMRKVEMTELEFDNLLYGKNSHIKEIVENYNDDYVFKNNILAVLTNSSTISFENKLKNLDK